MSDTRHTLSRPFAVLVASVALCGLGVGCSTDDLADKVSEKVAEAGSGGDVDVDSENGEVSFESGDGSTKVQVGTAELPEGWPADIPLPADYELTQSVSTTNTNSPTFSIGGTLADDATEVFKGITDEFVAAGWTETTKMTNTFDGGENSNASYENGSWEVIFSTSSIDGVDGFGYTAVQATE